MSDSLVNLHRKISSAGDLQGVVRTMKAMAASNIGQYEQSVRALADYDRTVLIGLGQCFRSLQDLAPEPPQARPDSAAKVGAIVFGSDQGLVGRFNDVVAEHAIEVLAALPGKPQVWAIGERVQVRLADAGLTIVGHYPLPNAIEEIAQLVSQIQIDTEAQREANGYEPVYVFHNRPLSGSLYTPVSQRLLPLDATWQKKLAAEPWPTRMLPEVIGQGTKTLRALIGEHLFISLFRACAESLASENASRLAAMERADKNIKELLETLTNALHSQRQNAIDEELFDVTSGYEAISLDSSRYS
ncbi:MAG: F0F1 ATP synthase subunit gamma [Luteimonas sp.]